MSTDVIVPVPTPQGSRPYTRIVQYPFVFLVPYTAQTPVCQLLWEHVNANRQPNILTLRLINVVSGNPCTVSVQCETKDDMVTYWETTQDTTSLNQSDHPCNLSPPACAKQAPLTHPRDSDSSTPASIKPDRLARGALLALLNTLGLVWQRSSNISHTAGTPQEEMDDEEIPELKLLRASMRIGEDVRAYRVIIKQDCRISQGGAEVIFCISFSFGRCVRGNNTLSCRCPEPKKEEDYDHGLTITIE